MEILTDKADSGPYRSTRFEDARAPTILQGKEKSPIEVGLWNVYIDGELIGTAKGFREAANIYSRETKIRESKKEVA